VGQFLPTADDRDGDGLPDAADCAADDPTRPALTGPDPECDGLPPGGLGIPVDLEEPGRQHAASAPSRGTPATRAAARQAARVSVAAVSGLRLGRSVAVYAPARPRASRPTLVLVARANMGLVVRPVLARRDGTSRRLAARRRSLARGDAHVVRIRVDPAAVRRVRLAVTVTDAQGDRHRAVHRITIAP
jgi:hypothetical protein